MFGSQAVLAWRRWKIQNAHFFIRLEYWATIILLVILGKLISLTPPIKTKKIYENLRNLYELIFSGYGTINALANYRSIPMQNKSRK